MFYGPELARVHDAGFGAVARAAAAATAEMLAEAGFRDGLVVDLGCGTGIGAAILLDAGYDVVGVDLSADALEIAHARAPAARFEQASLFGFEPPPCVGICIAGEGVCYAADERAGHDGARQVFARAHAALEPGGLLVFDVVTPGREPDGARRMWTEGDGWLICVENREDPERRLVERSMAVFMRDDGGAWRRADEHHVQHTFTAEDVLADLDATGFDARSLDGYGDGFRFGRGHAGFAAVRR